MGVHGLWSLLTPVARPIALETLAGRRLAIDASIWMYQFQMAMRDKKTGDPLQGAHIMGTFRRILKLLYHGIKPVFVFDGDAPMLKKRTIAERKRRKAGAGRDLAKTAQQLLSAQLRAAAAAALKRRQDKGKGKAVQQQADDDTGDLIDDDAVYLDDLDRPQGLAPPPPKKFIPKDQYALPSIDGPLEGRASASDPRIATEAEVRDFFEGMRPEDFDADSELIDSDFFANLPTEVKYEIIGDLRIKSRQVNHRRVDDMKNSTTPLDFSRAQIKNLMQRNTLTQKLFSVTDELGQSTISIPTRVAGSRNREYVLVKQDADKGGGWVLGVKNPQLYNKEPIVIDGSSDESSMGGGTDSDEFEEVGIPRPKARSPTPDVEVRRALAMEAVRARYVPNAAQPALDPYLDQPAAIRRGSLFDSDALDIDESMDPELQAALLESVRPSKEVIATPFVKHTGGSGWNTREVPVVVDPGYATDDSLEYVDMLPSGAARATPVSVVAVDDSDDSDDFEEVAVARVATSAQAQVVPPPVRDPVPVVETGYATDESMEYVETAPRAAAVVAPAAAVERVAASNNRIQSVAPRPIPLPPTRHTPAPLPRSPSPPPHVPSLLDTLLPSDSDDSDFEVVEPTPARPRAPSIIVPPVSDIRMSPEEEDLPVFTFRDRSQKVVPPVPVPVPVQPVVERVKEVTPPTYDLYQDVEPVVEEKVRRVSPVVVAREVSPDWEIEEELEKFEVQASPVPIEAIIEDVTSVSPAPIDAPVESDDEGSIEWEKSPSPPPRAQASLFAPDPDDSEPDYAAEEEEMEQARALEREQEQYADMLSQLKNRRLDDMQVEAQGDIARLQSQRNTDQRNADGVTRQMATDIKDLLALFGIPYVDAPQEAEAECAELLTRHLVDGIVTDDSDVFLFGGSRIYRNMFNDDKYVECYLLSDLEKELGLDRDKLVRLAYLLGGDYADGLPGVGPVLGRELLDEFEGKEGLDEFKEWWGKVQSGKDGKDDNKTAWRRKFKKGHKKLFIDESWPNPAIARAYYRPSVNESDEQFSWAGPDLDGLRTYLNHTLSWASTKTDELMLPLIKRQTQRKNGTIQIQGSLGDYFDMTAGNGPLAPREKRVGYASARLQNVVQSWRKNQRVGGKEAKASSDEESENEEDLLPPRPPKVKAKKAAVRPNAPAIIRQPSPVLAAAADPDLLDDPPTPPRAVARPKPKAKAKAASKAPAAKRGPAKSTVASRKRADKQQRDERAAANDGVYSSEDEFDKGPAKRRAPAKRAARRGVPVVEESEEDNVPYKRKRPLPRLSDDDRENPLEQFAFE